MKVLILDDETEVLEMLVTIVSNILSPDELKTFQDPLKALESLEVDSYDLVVSDLNMPGLNGVELLKKVHEKKGADTPNFIFNTGHPESVVLDDELSSFVVGTFDKVSNISSFLEALSKHKSESESE